MGIQNYGFSNLWVLKICVLSKGVDTQNVWVQYLYLRVLKIVGSKIEGIQILGYSNFVVIKHEVKLENRTWVLSKKKRISPFFI